MVSIQGGDVRAAANKAAADMKRIMAEPELQGRMKDIGLIPVDSPSVEGIQKYVNDEEAKWGGIVRKLGLAGSQ